MSLCSCDLLVTSLNIINTLNSSTYINSGLTYSTSFKSSTFLQKTFELLSEGQEELMNFEEEYFDLDHETLENEFIDFQVILCV